MLRIVCHDLCIRVTDSAFVGHAYQMYRLQATVTCFPLMLTIIILVHVVYYVLMKTMSTIEPTTLSLVHALRL